MKIFVSGLCGYLGRAVAKEAVARGHEIVGVDRGPWPAEEPMPPRVRLERGALDDWDRVAPLLAGCDAVIHAAALHLGNGFKEPLSAFIHANVVITSGLVERAIDAGVRRFALCSSMNVQVGHDWLGSGRTVLDETMPVARTHPYGASKLMTEEMARSYARLRGVSIGSIRHMAFGHGSDESGLNLLARYLSSRDAAIACILAVERDGLEGIPFNIGSASPINPADIEEAQTAPTAVLERLYPGSAATLKRLGLAPKPEHFWPVACNRRARELLGYEPRDTFAAWLRSVSC